MQGNRGKIGKKQWYEHVPKLVETSQGGRQHRPCITPQAVNTV